MSNEQRGVETKEQDKAFDERDGNKAEPFNAEQYAQYEDERRRVAAITFAQNISDSHTNVTALLNNAEKIDQWLQTGEMPEDNTLDASSE